MDSPEIHKLIIFYFSGTGNAKFAAEKIADIASKNSFAVSVKNIAEKSQGDENITPDTILGFCFPTHGFNAPPKVISFIRKFPKGRNKIFLLNTRAGMKMYKIHTPGLGGIALWLPALILFFKGYKPIGFRPLDMPSNWISLHPGLRKKVVTSIYKHCEKTLERFSKRIINGKRAWNGLLWLPIDLTLLPISVGYYFYGRFALAKTFYASHKCNNCNRCIKECPVNAIKEIDGRPYWTFNCESCMRCMNHCPQRAIETAHGFTIFLWWFCFSLIPAYLAGLLLKYHFITKEFYHNHFLLIIYGIILLTGLILIFAGYRILHFLLRFKFFERIIVYTSLTKFKFWRRYKKE